MNNFLVRLLELCLSHPSYFISEGHKTEIWLISTEIQKTREL